MFWFLLACNQPDPAPRDLDTLAHDLWADYAAKDDAALRADGVDLRSSIDEAALPLDGSFTGLTADEAALAGAPGVDPTRAVGMFTVGVVGCTPDQMERILFATNQDELYPGNYTDFTRDYTADLGDFRARRINHLTWDSTYTVDIPFTGSYTSTILGGVHFTADEDGGPYLVSTTVMPGPASTQPDTVVFDVDLQLEVFYPHDGGMVHLFGMWRNIVLPSGLGTDSDIGVSLIVGGMHDWDDATTAICDEGRI